MAGFGGSVKLTGESEYKKALADITQNLKVVSAEMKATASSFDAGEKSEKQLAQESKQLSDSLEKQKSALSTLKGQLATMTAEYEKTGQKHQALVKEYDQEKKKLDDLFKELSEFKQDHEKGENHITSSMIKDKQAEYDAQLKVIKELHPLCFEKTIEDKRVAELMETVGLSKEHASRYVHSFSGGQRQRIGIARALASSPQFIMCDEPVSALDVSIQAQILNTFQDLQKQFGLTYLFVAHNLLVVKHISDRIAVMYLGHIVELANSEELYDNPLHPYTISLLSSIPEPDPNKAKANKRQILEGDIPSPLNAPSGCPFRTRCPKATKECADKLPELREISKDHFVACRLFEDK